jgi:hypothetical protein
MATICHAAETWLIPADQRDPGAVAEMLEAAVKQGAKVWQDGTRFFLQGMLPREFGVNAEVSLEPIPSASQRVTQFAPEGTLRGTGSIVTLDHAENATFLGTSFLLDRIEGVAWAADGTIILDSAYASGSSSRALNFARQFGLRVTMVDEARPAYELKRPRLGLAARGAWLSSLLEHYSVPYTLAHEGDAPTKFDTVITEEAADWDRFAQSGGTVIRVPAAQGGEFTRVLFNTKHPVAFGMPREELARSTAGEFPATGTVIANFAGPARPAIIEEVRGKGRVISFAFRPDTYATCKLLLNAVYLGSARKL